MKRDERVAHDGFAGVEPVLFYRAGDEWGFFSNFSDHEVWMRNPWTNLMEPYQTSEHRFQAMKACNAEDYEYVVNAPTAMDSKRRGKEIALIDGWNAVGQTQAAYRDGLAYWTMYEVCLAKLIQHAEVREGLLKTIQRPIYEDAPKDSIWGWRSAGGYQGKNLLGRVWMDLRDVVSTIG